jgi:hypothetical protein
MHNKPCVKWFLCTVLDVSHVWNLVGHLRSQEFFSVHVTQCNKKMYADSVNDF